MTLNPAPPAAPADPRHRRLPQARIEDMLLLAGCAFEVEAGCEAQARIRIRRSLERCIAAGLGHGRDDQGRAVFDPAEVLNFLIWAGLSELDDFWIGQMIPTGRARASEWDEPSTSGERFRVIARRTFDLRRGHTSGADVRLRLPLPLAGAHSGTLSVRPEDVPGLDAEIKVSDGRLDVRLSAPPTGVVTIGAVVEFGTTPDGASIDAGRLDPAEADVYLRPIEGPIRVTPRLLTLARRLAVGNHPLQTAMSIWDFMIDDLGFAVVRYDEVPAHATGDWVLETGRYDCQLASALFISLCRANGIPARMVSGQFLYRLAPLSHFWAEVWIEGRGWLSFDFLAWGLSAGGRDLAWRNRFAGRSEPRMITQRLPLAFTGPMSVHFPPAWQMLQTRSGKGVEMTYTDISDGSLIYADHIEVERLT